MINFRYHVVSIVAVFLALAVGIVLGSTELQGSAFDLLKKTENNLTNDLNTRRAEVKALQQQVSADQQFASVAAAQLLPGRLAGQRVVFVAAPGYPGSVIGALTTMLRDAGASVTGTVTLQHALFGTSQDNQQYLSQLVQTTVASTSLTGFHLLQGASALEQAGQLLGAAILTKTDPSSGLSASESASKTVLAAFGNQSKQLITISGQPYVPATLAVVVAPASPPPAGGSQAVSRGLVTFAQGLAAQGAATLLASTVSGSGSGSAVAVLRGNRTAAAQISSVDDADTPVGQITTVWALAQLLATRKSASYGFAPGATAAAPSPAPSPSASPTASPTPSGHQRTSAAGRKPAKPARSRG